MTDGPAIAEHGLIGDLRTCALVSTDGTIDWFCAPRFDSPSVFGALLDTERGGCWTLRPVAETLRTHQFYFPQSAVLITRFLTTDGVLELHDFMPLRRAGDSEHRQRLVRRVVAVRGSATLRTVLDARPDYGRARCEIEIEGAAAHLRADGVAMSLTTTPRAPMSVDDGVVRADIDLRTGQSVEFVLEVLDPASPSAAPPDEVDGLFDATTRYWRSWIAQCRYQGRWRETVERSAITLKLLTHEPSGAIVAAPTTSLPEQVGGSRNWDYRYVWIRDAGFSLYALLRLGFVDEARAFVKWLSERLGRGDRGTDGLGPLRVLYDIDGNCPVEESHLDHLSGYRESRPVRVGNAAADQLQLDIYGDIIDSVYLFDKYGPGISHDAWQDVVLVVDWLTENWHRKDAGMWELRDTERAHTTSRLMCWVAIERAVRVARRRGLPADLARWTSVRDEIYQQIMSEAWNPDVEAFTQTEGSDRVDAGILLMPMVKFISPADPRYLSTLAAVERELVTDSLVFRYDPETDGLDGEEGTFSLCSFWYVEALTRVGRLDDARLALEKMFTYANHVGLYAEQVSATGDQVGNFPQAFTHLSLISAAINLDRALG
ncbi:glycosyl hydrolase, glucoamylase [Mycolicibacterium chubuense NBB4]|uniref:Glycosyl hydrolase, glucoamylase n=1 Tax=Mycolicibacterium chubuense (strain NBB4) TaxID=710421 RepID=I4BD71_MYCCN|nr:glycoside hydrolase family 15 protein [Mycolicibacterium chubuense]AFM15228.1 glycosyl hydrolase, glucoamylase [Mycolicibacterium chubuense NBB4]